MKRTVIYTLMILLTLALEACSELKQYEIQRTVEGNQFYSSFPELKVNIDPSLQYLGSSENKSKETSVNPNNWDIRDTSSSYLFGQFDPKGTIQKGILIRLTVVSGDPSKAREALSSQQMKSPLDSGTIKILDDEYDFMVFTANTFLTEEEKKILPAGTALPCFLIKLLEKNAGLGNKSQALIFYFEDASKSCLNPSCDECIKGGADVTMKQQILRGFDDRSYQAISFAEPKKIVDATSRYVKPEDNTARPQDKTLQPSNQKVPDESLEGRLRVLKDLLDKNLITKDDYEIKKKEILNQL